MKRANQSENATAWPGERTYEEDSLKLWQIQKAQEELTHEAKGCSLLSSNPFLFVLDSLFRCTMRDLVLQWNMFSFEVAAAII
jgi:hypothetical protein